MKNDILKSLKVNNLRKNSKIKIQQLLDASTKIILQTQTMGMDDCFRHNEPQNMPKADFWSWYNDNYADMTIRIERTNDVVSRVIISDCKYHFSNDVILTFDPADIEVIESGEDIELKTLDDYLENKEGEREVSSINVIWSESYEFTDNETLTLDEYNEKSRVEAINTGRGKGYTKTKVNIVFSDGTSEIFRHDIDADYPTIDIYYLAVSRIQLISKPLKIRLTYPQVVQALEDGYVSPLNSTEKRPTPPEDDSSRRVVSLGDFKARTEAKRERLLERAEKASAESDRYYKESKERASHIPFGQPILVGHHSEARARRDAERIYNDMGKSVMASKKAAHLESRAHSVGTNGIASDDPEAITKLKEKLASLVRAQEMMKAANKVIKSAHMSEDDKIEYMITSLGMKKETAIKTLEPDYLGQRGFPSYSLSNNNATIRKTRERIEELEALHNQAPFNERGELEGLEWDLYEDDGRIKFSFSAKPSEEVRNILKSNGFKWSRTSNAWVRKITSSAVYATKTILKQFDEV
ncbi:DUF3560 domain-containing protein [Photobacterium damselae subsp. damselae]|uniref:DUF3560 domain-containing protein n=1 Tax=Photobacterium damselae TaxID=38293 RepID=UPI00311B2746